MLVYEKAQKQYAFFYFTTLFTEYISHLQCICRMQESIVAWQYDIHFFLQTMHIWH